MKVIDIPIRMIDVHEHHETKCSIENVTNIRNSIVEKGLARIISIDEAVELLGENNSLRGEFKKYSEGKSKFVFYVPITKQLS